MSCSIGEFHTLHYKPMLKKYAYHRMLLCVIRQEWIQKLRIEDFLSENNAVMTERDYAEALKA